MVDVIKSYYLYKNMLKEITGLETNSLLMDDEVILELKTTKVPAQTFYNKPEICPIATIDRDGGRVDEGIVLLFDMLDLLQGDGEKRLRTFDIKTNKLKYVNSMMYFSNNYKDNEAHVKLEKYNYKTKATGRNMYLQLLRTVRFDTTEFGTFKTYLKIFYKIDNTVYDSTVYNLEDDLYNLENILYNLSSVKDSYYHPFEYTFLEEFEERVATCKGKLSVVKNSIDDMIIDRQSVLISYLMEHSVTSDYRKIYSYKLD